MDDHRDDRIDTPDEGALLAVYLAAETDEITTARLERRLRDEPELAARLDALARTRARLQRLDAVAVPPELRDRVAARLRAERDAPAATSPHTAARSARTSRGAARHHRPGPTQRGRRLSALSVAAGLLLLAVVAGGVVVGTLLPRSGSDEAAQVTSAAEADGGQIGEPGERLEAPEQAPGAAGGADTRDDSAGQGAERSGGSEASAAGTATTADLPETTSDADIAARLRDATASGDAVRREAQLRRDAELPRRPVCTAGLDTTAVDLVMRDGQTLLTALVTEDDRPTIVLFDPNDCARVRTFTP